MSDENHDCGTAQYFASCACHPKTFRLARGSQTTTPIDGKASVLEFSCEEMEADAITQRVGDSFKFGELKL